MRQPIESLAQGTLRPYRIYDGMAPFGPGEWVSLSADFEAAWYLRSGGATVRFGNQVVRVRTGDWLFLGLGPREQRFDDDCMLLSINYRWLDRHGRPLWPLSTVWMPTPARTATLTRLGEALSAAVCPVLGNPVYLSGTLELTSRQYVTMQAAFLAWLVEATALLEASGTPIAPLRGSSPAMIKARDLLWRHPLGDAADLTGLARATGISRSTLERQFRLEEGCSPHGYLERRRLQVAKDELMIGQRPIKDIATTLGFTHLSQFSAWFRRLAGASPRAFRQQHRHGM
jgi:AraC-like DNA-binding protein